MKKWNIVSYATFWQNRGNPNNNNNIFLCPIRDAKKDIPLKFVAVWLKRLYTSSKFENASYVNQKYLGVLFRRLHAKVRAPVTK